MMMILVVSVLLSLAFYEVVGVSGYLAFGDGVEGNILANTVVAAGGSAAISLANVCVAICLTFSVPIIVWPLRSAAISTYHMTRVGPEGELPAEITKKEWYFWTSVVVTSTVLAAWCFPHIDVLLSIVGSVGGACIVFIYPAAFYLRIVKALDSSQWWTRDNLLPCAMILGGGAVGVMCFTLSLYKVL